MAQNKLEVFGPVALTNTYTTNIFAPAAAGASGVGYTPTATYILLKKIRVVNKTASAATFRLFKGATGANAAGSELAYDRSVPAFGEVEIFCSLRLEGTNGFLVGGASAATTLTIEGEGEVGLV